MASPGALGSVTDVDRARSQGPSHTPSPSEHQGVQAAQAAMPSRPASHGSGAYPPPNPSLDQAIAAPGGAPMSSTTPPVPAPQPSPRTGLHVSPPAATPRQETPQGRAMKYASPDQGAPRRDLQASDQYTAIANAISQASPGIVRQVLRDNWERCLLGSEYHVAFVLNATLHQASSATLNRAVQDFGAKMVNTSKPQLLEHFTTADFDQVVDLVLSRMSPSFLDRALAQRLETIDARSLVNALARAERLGYDVQDIIEEKTSDKPEHVIPSLTSMPPLPTPFEPLATPSRGQWTQPPQYGQSILVPPGSQAPTQPTWYNPSPPPLPSQHFAQPPTKGPAGIHYCQDCHRPCSGAFALQYHLKKNACDPHFKYDKVGKTICLHCGCTFGSGTGNLYHTKSEVCGKYSSETTDATWRKLEQYWHRIHQQPGNQQAAVSTPVQPNVRTPSSAKAARNGTTINGDDPYAHLTADSRRRYQEEQAKAETKYGALMREAMTLPEPQRSDKLSKLKNSYNTKQSTTRKRFGIRLRERRTKEDIEAERIRLLGTPDANEIWLEQERAANRLRSQNEAPVQSRSGPATPATPAGQNDSPRKRVPLSEMGGLSGSVGSAETTDPTAYLTSSQPRGLAQLQSQGNARAPVQQATRGTWDGRMSIDEDDERDKTHPQSRERESDGSSSSDDNDDIPATS